MASRGVSMDEKSSPTTSGPDSDVASVEDLPNDTPVTDENEGTGVTEELSTKVSAGANYIGSIFSNAWTKTAKTANDATTSSSSFLTSAFNKVGGSASTSAVNSTKNSPKEENKPITEDETQTDLTENSDEQNVNKNNISASASAFFSNAWNKVGTYTVSNKNEKSEKVAENSAKSDSTVEEVESEQKSYFSNFSNMVGKVANNATSAIKDKVGNVGMIGEFNKQQEDFIKNKGPGLENGLAPWVGSCDEEAMKSKILSLSKDKRNFLRAPPTGVTFEFDYSSVSATALALLQEDPQLEKMRYELVPKSIKEDEFWRNYFYRVNLIKQSFDLKDLEADSSSVNNTSKSAKVKEQNNHDSEEVVDNTGNDGEDEFVSESYQASSKDIKEANASMKRLGVKGNETEEWEAELEGELNEFEMVNSNDENTNDPELENQIEEMLEADEKQQK